jgi:hypothetical protein
MFNHRNEQRLYALITRIQSSGVQIHGTRDWEDNIMTYLEQVVEGNMAAMEQAPQPHLCPSCGMPDGNEERYVSPCGECNCDNPSSCSLSYECKPMITMYPCTQCGVVRRTK